MTVAIRAASRASGINGRTTCEQRNSWRWSAIVPQRAKHGIGVVHVTRSAQIACAVAAQVVALRGQGAREERAVPGRIVCDNAVLECHGAARISYDAEAIVTDGAVANL